MQTLETLIFLVKAAMKFRVLQISKIILIKGTLMQISKSQYMIAFI